MGLGAADERQLTLEAAEALLLSLIHIFIVAALRGLDTGR